MEDKSEHMWDMILMILVLALAVTEVLGEIGKKAKSISLWIWECRKSGGEEE